MRKSLAVLVTATVVLAMLSALPAEAKKKRKKVPKKVTREASAAYDTPAIGHPDAVAGCLGSMGCATFEVGPKEKFVTLRIEDSLGTPVYALGGQDLDGDGFADTAFRSCGETTEPVAIEPGYELNLLISAGPGTNPACAGAASMGTVNAVFSNRP